MSHSLTALSLGAGVQSTTLALLAEAGDLPKPDVAIFADTGWEPADVYEHLDRLEAALSFPVIRVSRGNLRKDIVDPSSRFASIPYFVLAQPGRTPLQVVCPTCHGEVADLQLTEEEVEAGDGCPECGAAGRVADPSGTTRELTRTEREGMGRRQCTSEYKLVPIRRKVRELLGATPPDFRRVPAGRVCEQWVGFSTDEVQRANRRKDSDGVRYLTTRYPLLELGMSRTDCERWLRVRGWGSTAKSACIGCPFHGNRQWRELRDRRPAEWADAVAFDEQIRRGGARGLPLNGEAFLHRSRVPLSIAPIDRVTAAEWHDRQGDIFDAVADQQVEDGDPDGCSPYGCRSGEQSS